MSMTSGEATTSAKSERREPISRVTWRVGDVDLAALDAVEAWVRSTTAQPVTLSQVLRRAVQLAAATVTGNRSRVDAMLAKVPRVDPAKMDEMLAALGSAEDAHRRFGAQISRIGNNVNQLTMLAHRGEHVDSDAIAGVERALSVIAEEMLRWGDGLDRQRDYLTQDL